MQARQLLIVAGVAIVAFAAAFGIAGAGGDDQPKAASDGVQPAEVIEIDDVAVTAGVSTARRLPPLQVPKKKPKEADDGATTAPPATEAATPPASETATPPVTDAAPPSTSSPPPTSGGEDSFSSGGGE